MKWVALIYAAEWISVGLAVSTAIHVTGDLRALWFFLIPALSGVKYHEDDGGGKKWVACPVRTTYPLNRPSSALMPRARHILCPACAKLVQTT